jgi:guanylate kinase
MIVLVGASASGKTELAKQLYQYYGYTKCITTTTREPRINEVDGVDYHFLTKQSFEDLIKQDAFYEVTHYNGYLYGIQKKDVNNQGVIIVDPHGANVLVEKAKKDVFVVFVEPSESFRKERMLKRGDALSLINQRLKNDATVFQKHQFIRIDLDLINEDHSLDELERMVHQAYQNSLNH